MLGRNLQRMGLLSDRQLLEALDAQEAKAPSIPLLAVDLQVMSLEAALALLDRRAEGDERPFEVIALEQFWLTREDIHRLHVARSQRRPKLGDVLVRLGFATREQVEQALDRRA